MTKLYFNSDTNKHSVLLDGKLHEVPSETLDRVWKTRSSVLTYAGAPPFPVGNLDLTGARLIRPAEDPEVYFVVDKLRRHVVSEAQLYDFFETFDNVTVTTLAEACTFALGPPLSEHEGGPLRHRFPLYTRAGADGEHVAALIVDSTTLTSAEDKQGELIKTEVYTRFKDDFDFILLVGKKGTRTFAMTSNRGVSEYREGGTKTLRAVMTLPSAETMWCGAFLHEVAHTWAQYIVTTWGFKENTKYRTGTPRGDSASVQGAEKSLKGFDDWAPTSGLNQAEAEAQRNRFQGRLDAVKALVTTESVSSPWSGLKDNVDDGHWGISDAGGQLGGYLPGTVEEKRLADGWYDCKASAFFGYNCTGANARPYALLERWLMGLATPEELPKLELTVWEQITEFVRDADGNPRWTGKKRVYSSAELQALASPPANQGKTFRSLILIVTDVEPTDAEWNAADAYARWFSRDSEDFSDLKEATGQPNFPKVREEEETRMLNFWQATGNRARIKTKLTGWGDSSLL